MRTILILGAGKSSAVLIDYLVENAPTQQWKLTVADLTAKLAKLKTKNRPHTTAVGFDLHNETERKELIANADIVISMLPAAFHLIVAYDCIEFRKNLITPSYVSQGMGLLNQEVENKGLLFLNEMGLDPGIDHMSALQLLDDLKLKGCKIIGFQSHCGGLVAPESDNNPWHYKFSWNPRNVVLAGQGEGGIHYLKNGNKASVGYKELFRHTQLIDLGENGIYESYPNRNSLQYITEYNLQNIETMYRGTLRVPPFCKGWNCLVELGLTRPNAKIGEFLREDVMEWLNITADSEEMQLLEAIDLFNFNSKDKFIISADFLQKKLEKKWTMKPEDKDMVVMIHQIEYEKANKNHRIQSSLVLKGKDSEHTAMAMTVGLPMAIATKLILNNKISKRGVILPKYKEIYDPVLKELQQHGIIFKEEHS